MKTRKIIDRLTATPGRKISLKRFDPKWSAKIKDKKEAEKLLADGIDELAKLQDKLYAQDTRAVLILFQAMDAAGKDGTIRHVMSGINPQGCQVFSASTTGRGRRGTSFRRTTSGSCATRCPR